MAYENNDVASTNKSTARSIEPVAQRKYKNVTKQKLKVKNASNILVDRNLYFGLNKKIYYGIFILFCLLLYSFLTDFFSNELSFALMGDYVGTIFVFISLVYALYCSTAGAFSWLNPWILTLGCYTIFLLSRIFVSKFLGLGDFYSSDYFFEGSFGSKTISKVYIILCVYLAVWGILAKPNNLKKCDYASPFISRVGLWIWFLAVPFHLAKVWWYYRSGGLSNYLLFYTGELASPPMWITAPGSLVLYGFHLYLAGRPKNKYIFYIFLFQLFLLSLLFARGSRGEAMISLISTFWLYNHIRAKTTGFFRTTIFVLGLIITSQIIAAIRSNEWGYQDDNIVWFFYGQGISIVPLSIIVDLDGTVFNQYDGVKAVLSPLAGVFTALSRGEAQFTNDSAAGTGWSLAHRIAIEINPSKYVAGQGLGTVAVGEGYLAAGLVGVALVALVHVGILNLISSTRLLRDDIRNSILAGTLAGLLFCPRETAFYFMVPMLKAILLAFFALWLEKQRKKG